MKQKTLLLSISLIICFVVFLPCINSEERLDIKVGELKSIFTDSPRRISVSNPEIADVTSVANNEVLVIGKSPGNTILTIWDKWGQQTKSVDVYLENLSSLEERIERLFKTAGIMDVTFKVNKEENKIILTGYIKNKEKEKFDLLIEPFKDKLLNLINIEEDKASVLIDVNILELSKSALDDLGIDWSQSFTATEKAKTGVAILDTAGPFADMFKIGNWTRTALSAKLNLLVKNGKGKILSRPKLTCVSGKEAKFLVGGEVPIFTANVSTTGVFTSTVEYKEYGIILNIKPTIENDGGIRVALNTEVSELGQVETTAYSRAYPLTKRNASTELYLKEGQTIFLAGILKNKDSETISRVPGIGDIPVLGHLFRSRDFTNDQTELVITLTPTIIEPDSEKEKWITEEGRSEEIKNKSEEISKIPEPEQETTQPSTKEITLKELKDPIADYAQSVQKAINEKFSYPQEAKEKNESGTVVLSLRLLKDGSVSNVMLSRSAGSKILDESAISLVRTIPSFQPFPNDLPLEDIWIDIPIEYHLN